MKNLKSFLIILVAITSNFIAKGQVFTQETKIISAGIGIPNMLKQQFSQIGANAKGLPVILCSFDHGLNEEWSIGGLVAYTSASIDLGSGSYNIVDKWKFFIIGVKGDYHFGNEKVDFYGGSVLGYASISETMAGANGAKVSGIVYYPHLGLRYPFSPKISGFAELGFGISIINLGLSISLN